MKTKQSILFALVSLFLLACNTDKNKLTVVAPSGIAGERVVEISDPGNNEMLLSALSEPFIIRQNGKEIQTQIYNDPVSGQTKLLIYPKIEEKVQLEFVAGEEGKQTFAPLAHAELWHKTGGSFVDEVYTGGGDFVEVSSLRVPDECTDHSLYIKYEGPGWESNLVGYRFYLDWRNAVDVYGKITDDMILDGVGQDGYESYHHMQDWGMDVLKVGPSLGVGSIGYWNGEAAERVAETDSVYCEIISPEGLRAAIQTNYYGWTTQDFKTNVKSFITIDANSRMSKETLVFDQAPGNVCTGIHIDKNAEKIELEKGNWVCLATWGKQSLNDDQLGLFVLVEKATLLSKETDKNNHVLVLQPKNNQAEWYFGAAWELEPNGITSIEAFKAYLEQQLELLNSPDEVLL
ncbi:DUF4861 family protein [Roseimarinus sediminis]|uniref:DUF4861 family protein n=1 Tax=Roseimarinus sediminis TaxID=1610899 RepID=UPI003D1EA41D